MYGCDTKTLEDELERRVDRAVRERDAWLRTVRRLAQLEDEILPDLKAKLAIACSALEKYAERDDPAGYTFAREALKRINDQGRKLEENLKVLEHWEL